MGINFPPLGFPLYGLGSDWDGPRWLHGVEGPSGHPTTGVRLGHGGSPSPSPGQPWAGVATLPRDQVRDVAFTGALTLVDATMPAPGDRPDDFKQRVVEFVHREADRWLEWAEVVWTVDSQSVSARVFPFAGAWVGFTTAMSDVDVLVVGVGMEPGTLALAQVVDSSAYHFDIEQPIAFPDTVERSRSLALGPSADVDGWWPAHPDHARVTDPPPGG